MPGSRPVAHNQLTLTNTQGKSQAVQLLKLLHEFKSSSVRIDIGPFMTLLRRRELVWDMPMGSDERIEYTTYRSQSFARNPDS
jgi:hypothetical protein